MAANSGDFGQQLLLAIIDKAVLSVFLAGMGLWFQKRLEVFKRDQSLASDLARARLNSYFEVFQAVAAIDYAAMKVRAQVDEKRLEEKTREAFKTTYATAFGAITKGRYLLGEGFTLASARFVRLVSSHTEAVLANGSISNDAAEKFEKERRRCREAMDLALPRFARAPPADLHFNTPDIDTVLAKLSQPDSK